MFLVVGLGNPGNEYAGSRHNVGFLFLDELASQVQTAGMWQNKFHGIVQKATWNNVELLLLKPLTFMNLSGTSVLECMTFYKIPPEKLIVVFDDLDQNPGAVRVRFGGGHGGHNGVRDILAKSGSDKFHRIKIGIGKPDFKGATVNWVLGKFSPTEMQALQESFKTSCDRLAEIIKQYYATNK